MKQIITVVLISLLSFSAVLAQGPNVTIYGAPVSGATGTSVEVIFRVTELHQITNIEGSIIWDTSVADFDTISSFALPYFNASTFDLTNSANGVITFEWAHLITIGGTLTDSSIIFTLRFNVVGGSGTSTLVELTNSPVPLYWYNFSAWSGPIDVSPGQINVTTCATPIANYSSSIMTGWTYGFTDLSSGTIDSWLWDFGDGTTDTTANAIHTFATADTFMVCLYVTNICGTDSICNQVITTNPTAIGDVSILSELKIYPNPAQNSLYVYIEDASTGLVEISLINLQGMVIDAFVMENREEYIIDVSSYRKGMYFIKAEHNNKINYFKVIIN